MKVTGYFSRRSGMFTALCLSGAFALTGCATAFTPVGPGILMTDVKGPVSSVDGSTNFPKTGSATCTSVLGLFASGDCSIEAAGKAGGLTKIHAVDHESWSVLGIYARFTTIVKGE
jgi:hypothetical protein